MRMERASDRPIMDQAREEGARRELRQHFAKRPVDARAYLLLGELWEKRGDFDRARAAYQRSQCLVADPSLRSVLQQVLERLELHRMRRHLRKGEFEPAFRIAERLLDSNIRTETLEGLIYPMDGDGRILPASVMYDLLDKLRERPEPPDLRHWYVLLRMGLLDRLKRGEEAFLAGEALVRLPRRYGWMRFHRAGVLMRVRLDYRGAEREYRAVLESAPGFWKAKACIAEAALCLGDRARAFRILDEVVSGAVMEDLASALAWRGEMRLWCGQYQEAIRDLERAIERQSWLAQCWRGAAFLQLGDMAKALEDLNAYLRKIPDDREALTWRGEARRREGQWDAALEDLETAIRLGDNPFWALVNRALVRAALGDTAGMWSDFFALPQDPVAFFQWKLGLQADPGAGPEAACRLLEHMLEAGGGIRRNDQYLYPLWLKRP